MTYQFGFQTVVIKHPTDKEGNIPVYWQKLVARTDTAKTELLKSSSQVVSARGAEVSEHEHSEIVVNMHSFAWNGDKQ